MYSSPRGQVKALAQSTYTVTYPYSGLLPSLPNIILEPNSIQNVWTKVESIASQNPSNYLPSGIVDSYWTGKALGKVADLAMVADQIGDKKSRDILLSGVKRVLEDWFTASDGTPNFFFYDQNAGSLIG